MWISLRRLLSGKARQLGLEKSLEFQRLQKDWDEFLVLWLGKVFQKKTKPLKLKNKVLLVKCLNSVLANELQMKEGIILAGLKRAKFKEITIEKIKPIS